MTTVTDFLLARLAEDEAIIREMFEARQVCGGEPDVTSVPVWAPTAPYVGVGLERFVAEYEAKRAIIKAHTLTIRHTACQFCNGDEADVRGCQAPRDELVCATCGRIDDWAHAPRTACFTAPPADAARTACPTLDALASSWGVPVSAPARV